MKEYKGIKKDSPTKKKKGIQPYLQKRTPIQKDPTKLIIKGRPRRLVTDAHKEALNLSHHPNFLHLSKNFVIPQAKFPQNYQEVNLPQNFTRPPKGRTQNHLLMMSLAISIPNPTPNNLNKKLQRW